LKSLLVSRLSIDGFNIIDKDADSREKIAEGKKEQYSNSYEKV